MGDPQILVLEALPDLAPGLRFELGDPVRITAVTRVRDADVFFQRHPGGLLVWDATCDTAAAIRWLTNCLAHDVVPLAIVCRVAPFRDLEQPLRMLGVVSILPEECSHRELATLCRRMLTKTVPVG